MVFALVSPFENWKLKHSPLSGMFTPLENSTIHSGEVVKNIHPFFLPAAGREGGFKNPSFLTRFTIISNRCPVGGDGP
jgi:hypothetical protein